MIIGIGGYKGVGKNTAAEALRPYKFIEKSFAHPLKQICSEVFDLPYRFFDNPELKDVPFSHPLYFNDFNLKILLRKLQEYQPLVRAEIEKIEHLCINTPLATPRVILQFVGTDVVRNCTQDNFWIDILLTYINNSKGNFVITDVRLPNERSALKALGAKLILINRDGHLPSNHASENSLGDVTEYDLNLDNNSDIPSLQKEVASFYIRANALKRVGL